MSRETPLILLVDDETHILHVLSLRLQTSGYEVITAENGEEGLAAAVEYQPDLVITDQRMPYLTGVDLCRKLAEHECTREMVVLMLTARGSTMQGECVDLSNLAGVITKPFSPREVLVRVQELVGKAARRRVG